MPRKKLCRQKYVVHRSLILAYEHLKKPLWENFCCGQKHLLQENFADNLETFLKFCKTQVVNKVITKQAKVRNKKNKGFQKNRSIFFYLTLAFWIFSKKKIQFKSCNFSKIFFPKPFTIPLGITIFQFFFWDKNQKTRLLTGIFSKSVLSVLISDRPYFTWPAPRNDIWECRKQGFGYAMSSSDPKDYFYGRETHYIQNNRPPQNNQ